ncbi:RNA polymerase sigma factor, sigma-70 family [Algoriphagus faecimaris]|uniref:RNA polymerase sigma factor, sigma-70 family n=1 Tax=Algoriphagus faecimaris TaxID=686796 RepID=A0A1G6QL74_9BACT|nr:sigma-70 family RNA polymerase sigma factor [Algoriphagus faecimaris]SDC92407.1 RNA polymerase sigma factor, sigma-70 family [Algoriphagus faecimaris]
MMTFFINCNKEDDGEFANPIGDVLIFFYFPIRLFRMDKKENRYLFQEEILQALKKHDSEAVETLYRECWPIVKNHIMSNSGSLHEAEDLYQEAFLVFWDKTKQADFFLFPGASLQSFLIQIAKKLWLYHLRENRKMQTQVMEEFPELAEEVVLEEKDLIQATWAVFRTLGEKCRQILKAFYFEKKRMEEIAQEMNLTPQTARNSKYRCIKEMKSKLNPR